MNPLSSKIMKKNMEIMMTIKRGSPFLCANHFGHCFPSKVIVDAQVIHNVHKYLIIKYVRGGKHGRDFSSSRGTNRNDLCMGFKDFHK
jgi:hypothetical protein